MALFIKIILTFEKHIYLFCKKFKKYILLIIIFKFKNIVETESFQVKCHYQIC